MKRVLTCCWFELNDHGNDLRRVMPTLLGGVLIGGGSTRMGRPKHLLERAGRTAIEQTLAAARPHVEALFLLGASDVPPACSDMTRIADAAGVPGPLGGILGAMRYRPEAGWLIVACDHPLLTSAAIAWLVSQRDRQWHAILPRCAGGPVEPLLAIYEPPVFEFVEQLAARGESAPRRIAERPQVRTPTVPTELEQAWRNVNTPTEWRRVSGERDGG